MKLPCVALFVIAAMLVTSTAFAQVDYDSIRNVQDLVERLSTGGVAARYWSIHEEEDAFTRETRRYVVGDGKQGVLFIVATCDAVSLLFRNSAEVFTNGQIESIWDNGEIVEFQFDDRDSMLVTDGADWPRRLATHSELRVRVTAFPQSLASDEFDLTDARETIQQKVGTVGDLFDEIGCEF